MSRFELLYLSNILAIWFYGIFLIKVLGNSEHGLIKSLLRLVFYKDSYGWNWICERKYLFAFYILIPLLIGLSLGLLSEMQYGFPHIRKEWSTVFSILIWIFTALGINWANNKIK